MFMRIIRYDFCSRRELSTPAMFAKLCSKFLLFKEQTGDWLTEEKNLSSSFCILARLLCGTRHQSVSNFFENPSLSHSWETISDAKKKKKDPRVYSVWTTATTGFSPPNNTHPLLYKPERTRSFEQFLENLTVSCWRSQQGAELREGENLWSFPSIQITWWWTFVPPGASQILHLSVSQSGMLESFVSLLVYIH